jgi:hypothetical protein
VATFYVARSEIITPLPWQTFALPFSQPSSTKLAQSYALISRQKISGTCDARREARTVADGSSHAKWCGISFVRHSIEDWQRIVETKANASCEGGS